jgi:hypothetical protein
MSALGDYIHYNTTNYLYWGTKPRPSGQLLEQEGGIYYSGRNPARERNINIGVQLIQNTHDRITQELIKADAVLTNEQRIKIQNLFAAIQTSDPTHVDGLSQEDLEDLQQQIIELMQEQLKVLSINKNELDFTTLSSAGINTLGLGIKQVSTSKYRTYWDTIASRLQSLAQQVAVLKQGNGLPQDIQNLLNDLDQLANQITWTQLNTTKKKNTSERYYLDLTNQTNRNFIETLQQLIMRTNVRATDVNAVFGEARSAVVLYHLFGNAAQSLSKTIVGKEKNTLQISLAPELEKYINFSGYTKEIKGDMLKLTFKGKTSNKTDVAIEVQDNMSQNLFASIKNHRLSAGRPINVVQSTSLLVLLRYGGTDFANHVINILGATKPGVLRSAGYPSLQNEALEALKMTALVEAIRGYQGKGSLANVVIINDNSRNGRGIHVFTLYELFQLVYFPQSPGFSLFTGNAQHKWEDNEFFTDDQLLAAFQQQWIGKKSRLSQANAWERIGALISNIHSKKITIGLRPNLI